MKSRDEVYKEWRRLINMSHREIEGFLSEWGDVAGLSRSEAKKEGVRSGRDSARAIIRMKQKKKSNWSSADWNWARRQVAFVKRFTKNVRGQRKPRHKLYKKNGQPTRYLLSLLLWGHDPEKGR